MNSCLTHSKGQVTQAFSDAVTYDYTYDAAHRVATITDSRGPQTLGYTYTPGGRLKNRTQTHQNAEVSRTDYVYDAVGRLSAMWAGHGEVVTFVYDAGGRLTEQWLPNGVNARYTYNADNTLQHLDHRTIGSMLLADHDYTYDAVGNRATYIDSDPSCNTTTTATYTYDEVNRLIEVLTEEDVQGQVTNTTESYTYDAWGNRETATKNGTTTVYAYDVANQLTAIHQNDLQGPVLSNLSYDPNGNLETKTTNEGTLTLTYDAWDRMIQAQKPWTLPESYAYDDQGRRVRKAVGSSTTDYLYDGLDIVAEYTTNWATPNALYTHGGGIDSPLIRASQGGAVRTYYHQDGLGSVVAATNEFGEATGTARYDAWGAVARQTGGIPQYGYTGREPDNTGLVYYRSRYYDPDTGRFTQPDPIGLSGGTNLYAYAGGDPVNYTDPMGTTPKSAILAARNEIQSYHSNGAAQVQTTHSGAPQIYGGNVAQPQQPQNQGGGGFWNNVQTGLDVISIGLDATGVGAAVSWLPDVTNAVISAVRGDTIGAGLSLSGAVPYLGIAANTTRIARQASNISRRAPEFKGGRISESGFLDSAEKYLGSGYKSLPTARYVSKDGLRQVRYGKHETTGKRHHGHFESYDKPGGRVIENTVVDIFSD